MTNQAAGASTGRAPGRFQVRRLSWKLVAAATVAISGIPIYGLVCLGDDADFVTEQKVGVTGCYAAGCIGIANAAGKTAGDAGRRLADTVRAQFALVLGCLEDRVSEIVALANSISDWIQGDNAASGPAAPVTCQPTRRHAQRFAGNAPNVTENTGKLVHSYST